MRNRSSKRPFLFTAFLATAIAFASTATANDTPQCAILLHGLWRKAGSLQPIADDLGARGFVVVNQSYPTTKDTIPDLADNVIPARLRQCPKDSEVNFVTHSLGGILVRSYYAQHPDAPRPHAVVMLAPPNHGSEVIDSEIRKITGIKLTGPAGPQLGARAPSYVNQLGAVDYPVGVIAGDYSINPAFSAIIDGVDDGAVSVESTKLDGMRDFIILPTNHSFMMNDPMVRSQIANFLTLGKFAHNP